MARGGSRPGAGRKADPNSARQKRLAGNAAAAPTAPEKGFTAPDGARAADAPKSWPFGTAEGPAASSPEAEKTPGCALDLLQEVYKDPTKPLRERVQAAALALPFETAKPAPMGKKAAKDAAAREPGVSKFGAMAPPPRLVHSR